jgi:hypothetical protein
LNNERLKKVFKKAFLGVGVVFLAFIFYLVGSKIACLIAGVSLQERIGVFSNDGGISLYISLFKRVYISFLENILSLSVYGKVIIVIIAAALLSAGAVLGVVMLKSKNINSLNKISAIVLLAILPIGINSIYLISRGYLHDLMIYGIWMCFVFYILFMYKYINVIFENFHAVNFTKALATIVVGALIWQNVVISNQLYFKKSIETKSALSVMTRVVGDMEEFEEYEMGVTKVAFVGVANNKNSLVGFEKVSNIMGADCSSPIYKDSFSYFFYTHEAYFEYVLNYPINLCDGETRGVLKNDQRVVDMPAFPEKGYISYVDDIMVVKLG